MTLEQAEQKYQEYTRLLSRTAERSITPEHGSHWFKCFDGTNFMLTKEEVGEYERAKMMVENAKKKAELEQMLKMLEEGEIK